VKIGLNNCKQGVKAMGEAEKTLTNYPIQVKISINEEEMGGNSHVKNIYYVRYFESARVHYLQTIGLHELKSKTRIGEILAQSICNYRKPLVYPDQITVGAKVKSVGRSSLVMEYIIVSDKIGVAATGEEIIVIYDYHHSRKTELPLIIRETIEKLEGKRFQ